jgi:hypothetical protein
MTRYCRDCRHSRTTASPYLLNCATLLDVTTGLPSGCSISRSELGRCGPDAALWQARPAPVVPERATARRVRAVLLIACAAAAWLAAVACWLGSLS